MSKIIEKNQYNIYKYANYILSFIKYYKKKLKIFKNIRRHVLVVKKKQQSVFNNVKLYNKTKLTVDLTYLKSNKQLIKNINKIVLFINKYSIKKNQHFVKNKKQQKVVIRKIKTNNDRVIDKLLILKNIKKQVTQVNQKKTIRLLNNNGFNNNKIIYRKFSSFREFGKYTKVTNSSNIPEYIKNKKDFHPYIINYTSNGSRIDRDV
jgi:hypothetical protein